VTANARPREVKRDETRRQTAAEIIELGEMLFDTTIQAAAAQPAASTGGSQPVPIEELLGAAEAFFAALRVLLNVE
jgi:hypothetical protein